jgi:hypothetical protein
VKRPAFFSSLPSRALAPGSFLASLTSPRREARRWGLADCERDGDRRLSRLRLRSRVDSLRSDGPHLVVFLGERWRRGDGERLPRRRERGDRLRLRRSLLLGGEARSWLRSRVLLGLLDALLWRRLLEGPSRPGGEVGRWGGMSRPSESTRRCRSAATSEREELRFRSSRCDPPSSRRVRLGGEASLTFAALELRAAEANPSSFSLWPRGGEASSSRARRDAGALPELRRGGDASSPCLPRDEASLPRRGGEASSSAVLVRLPRVSACLIDCRRGGDASALARRGGDASPPSSSLSPLLRLTTLLAASTRLRGGEEASFLDAEASSVSLWRAGFRGGDRSPSLSSFCFSFLPRNSSRYLSEST